ncbi:MAG: hypothetical protein J5706_04575 [Elusimicrobiales bacterium]|nr:hypothetical protein [Elusimicrobiales bacterium]
MTHWLMENWQFCLTVAGIIGGGFKLYYTIERQLALMQQSLTELKEDIREDIARLEKKQDKYNNLQERTLMTEMEIKHLKEMRK